MRPQSRVRIELRTGREHDVVAATLAALATDPDVFVMNDSLVRVGEVEGNDVFHRDAGTLQVCRMTEPLIRVHVAKCAEFYRIEKRGEPFVEVVRPCPVEVIKAIAADGFWNGFRQLVGITTVPVMRHDGSVLLEPGYDTATRLIFAPCDDLPDIPNKPTQADAERAAWLLADIFTDFPFDDACKGIAACMGGILTLVARPMIDGPCPLFLVDGNRAGSGKSFIADVIAIIAGQTSLPRKSQPEDDAEFRKTITSIALQALRCVLIDNIARPLGCESLDAVLTGTAWQDRLLGGNKSPTFGMRTVWFATGNNVPLRGDTFRRVLRIPLDCRIENPETRSDFRYPNLLEHVRSNRTKLLAAALTMLRAWHVAGRPDGGLDTWGSFEAFSRFVRGTLVFSGRVDPAPSADRLEIAMTSDSKRAAIPVLLAAWPLGEHGEPAELKSSELATLAQEPGDLRDAIEQLLPSAKTEMNGRSIGNALRTVKGQVVGGRRLVDRQ